MQKQPRHGRRREGAGWFSSRRKVAAVARAPANAATAQQGGLRSGWRGAKASCAVWLRGERVVQFLSGVRCEAWRLARPFLFGAWLRVPQREKVVAPRRRATLRELSPYSSQQSRWRGGAAFWACYRASTTALQPPPAPRGLCEKKSQLGG